VVAVDPTSGFWLAEAGWSVFVSVPDAGEGVAAEFASVTGGVEESPAGAEDEATITGGFSETGRGVFVSGEGVAVEKVVVVEAVVLVTGSARG